ncbi:hypothetical protein D1872_280260 [compost metagenome]
MEQIYSPLYEARLEMLRYEFKKSLQKQAAGYDKDNLRGLFGGYEGCHRGVWGSANRYRI